jgi:general secretion pathway protein K
MGELLNVKGVTPDVYRRVRPYVCVVPGRTDINVNTASGPVVMSLANGINQRLAESIISSRDTQPFAQVTMFLQLLQSANVIAHAEGLTVSSNYFDVAGHIVVGAATVNTRTLIMRGQGSAPRILARQLVGDEND